MASPFDRKKSDFDNLYKEMFGEVDKGKDEAASKELLAIINAFRKLDMIDTGQLVSLGMGEAAALVRHARLTLREILLIKPARKE